MRNSESDSVLAKRADRFGLTPRRRSGDLGMVYPRLCWPFGALFMWYVVASLSHCVCSCLCVLVFVSVCVRALVV